VSNDGKPNASNIPVSPFMVQMRDTKLVAEMLTENVRYSGNFNSDSNVC